MCNNNIDVNGTSLQGFIPITYDELCKYFGPPSFGPEEIGDKVTCEWCLSYFDGEEIVATIYDYKVYDYTPKTLYNWHIGGFNSSSVILVNESIAGKHLLDKRFVI
jgi:hypothetical protein